MNRVELYRENYAPEVVEEINGLHGDGTIEYEEKVVEEYVGCVRAECSQLGVIVVQTWTGEQTSMLLNNYSRMKTYPMTDEDIENTPGLSEWYAEQKAEFEKRQSAQESQH